MAAARMHIHPEKIEIVKRSGCSFATFGCLFIIVGAFALLFVSLSAQHAAHHSVFERIVAGALGVAFMAVGTLFGFGKNGIVVDRSERTISKWTGLFAFRFVTDTYPFDEFSRFAIEQEAPYAYVVVVQGGTTTVTLLTCHSYPTIREHAEQIAAYLPLELDDDVERP